MKFKKFKFLKKKKKNRFIRYNKEIHYHSDLYWNAHRRSKTDKSTWHETQLCFKTNATWALASTFDDTCCRNNPI